MSFGKRAEKGGVKAHDAVTAQDICEIQKSFEDAREQREIAELKRIFALSGAAVIGLVVFTFFLPNSWQFLPGDSLETKAKRAVAARLRDPDSARFSAVQYKSTDFSDYVYGCVKGRNGFGGYGDWQGFWYTAKTESVDVPSGYPSCR